MKNLQKKGTHLKEKGRVKNKFGEFLREILGWTRKKTITTYDTSGKIIEVATVTTRLSVLTIIHKLFLESLILAASISILLELGFFLALQDIYNASLAYNARLVRDVPFPAVSILVSILFLGLFVRLRSNLLKEIDNDDAVDMAVLDDRQ